MKPRRVIVTLEIETAAPLALCRSAAAWNEPKGECVYLNSDEERCQYFLTVIQVQVNVIKPERAARKKKPR